MAMYLRHGEFLANIGFTAGIVVRAGREQTSALLIIAADQNSYNKPVCSNPALIRNLEETR
jgi:hypothetical protein